MPASPASAPLEALYQELILDHYRRPRHKGVLDAPDISATATNPMCGESITVAAMLDGDQLRDVRFTGQTCAIAQASASMMTDLVRGKTRAEMERLVTRLSEMLRGDSSAARDPTLGDLRALSGVARIPVRIPCALLPWRALADSFTPGA
jgi:nitrogen fixation NifU-like protein